MSIKHLSILILTLAISTATFAQRIVSELESNTDLSMDSRPDSLSSREKGKIVPNDIWAWTIDEKFGNIRPAIVDTISYLYQNADLPEGKQGHYNTLGNVGSPRLSRIFMERPRMSNFLFTDPYDMFFVDTEHFTFYNTKSPFMNVNYNWCGSKTTGDDHVKVTYTNNAGKRINFGGIFHYIYGQGYYDNQATSFMNASAWGSYLGDKYNMHLYYQHNFMKMGENGGITDEGYITNPEGMPSNYTSSDIPTYLSQTWNRQEHDVLFLNHHYNIGFYRTIEIDSVTTKEEFVPVSRFFHTFKLMKMMRNYRAYTDPADYHSYTFLPGDSIEDRTKNFSIRNTAGLSLCEGFNKYAVFGLDAYVGYEYMSYTMPDYINPENHPLIGFPDTYNKKYSEHNILIGGQIVRTQGSTFHYNLNAEFVPEGENRGQFEINGHGEANIPLLGDTAQIAINGYIHNLHPTFYFRHYHSKHAWWDLKTNKEFRQRIEAVITIPHTDTKITAGIENIKNYSYFQNNGITITYPTNSDKQVVTNNITPVQCKDYIQVMSINLRQNFKLGPLHFDNDITYQHTTASDQVLSLPALSTYNNLYLRFKIAKVLKTDFGADLRYFTEYNAPDYSPVLGQFMNQNANKTVKIGNYPIVSVYANFDLKRTRFYVQYYHLNQGTGRYFWGPGYPMNPTALRFGLSWNFYD
ncbi:MAG: putative porin [Prevotellaceae bacterium]|nr:putative porin [Candidatus Minthosoma caballi]